VCLNNTVRNLRESSTTTREKKPAEMSRTGEGRKGEREKGRKGERERL